MNILLDGYFDRNFGDDVMIRIVAYYLSNHNFYINQAKKELLLPFHKVPNIFPADKKINIQAKICVIGSGYIINSRMSLLLEFLDFMKHLRKEDKLLTATVCCNIGPFVNGMAKFLIVQKLKRNKFVTVRETFSLEFMKKNCRKVPSYYYPDIIFAMPDEWLPQKSNEGYLGISAYRRAGRNNLDFYEKMAQIADCYINKTGKKVLLFAFDIENENDTAAAISIKALCRNQKNVELVFHNDDGSNIINNFARCEKIVSVRFHSSILAIKMEIPFVPITYSEKTRNVLKDLKYQGKQFNIEDFEADDITRALESAVIFMPEENVSENARNHSTSFEKMIL